MSFDIANFRKNIQEFDRAIRRGEGQKVASHLISHFDLKAHYKKTPAFLLQLKPSERAALIEYLRRSGALTQALAVGYPLIRGSLAETTPPSEAEVLEYAAALIFSGLESEALQLLDAHRSTHERHVLYRAYAMIRRWDFKNAVVELRKYLEVGRDEYFLRIARLNLASALIFENQMDAANQLCLELQSEAQRHGNQLLLGNAFELLTQVALAEGDHAGARRCLDQAEQALASGDPQYLVFAKKWRAVMLVTKTQTWEPLCDQVIAEAQKIGNHESVRDVLFHCGVALKDSSLLLRLYHGTPYEGFRRRARLAIEKLGCTFQDQLELFVPRGALYKTVPLLRAAQGPPPPRVLEPAVEPPPKHRWQRLLLVLKSDLFSPWRATRLFQQLFAERFYDPLSSMNLLHQAVHDLRLKLKPAWRPFQVHWQSNDIYLSATRACTLVVAATTSMPTSVGDANLRRYQDELRKAFGQDRLFSAKAAGRVLGISARSTQRYLQALVDGRHLARSGSARMVRYKII